MLGLESSTEFYGLVGEDTQLELNNNKLNIGDIVIIKNRHGLSKGVVGKYCNEYVVVSHLCEKQPTPLCKSEVVKTVKKYYELNENDTVNYMWNIKVKKVRGGN